METFFSGIQLPYDFDKFMTPNMINKLNGVIYDFKQGHASFPQQKIDDFKERINVITINNNRSKYWMVKSFDKLMGSVNYFLSLFPWIKCWAYAGYAITAKIPRDIDYAKVWKSRKIDTIYSSFIYEIYNILLFINNFPSIDFRFRIKMHPISYNFYSDASGDKNHGVGAFINTYAMHFLWSQIYDAFPSFRRFDYNKPVIFSSYNTEFFGVILCMITFILAKIIKPNSLVNIYIYIYNDNNGVVPYLNKLKEPKFARLSEIFNMIIYKYRIFIIAHEISRSDPKIKFCDAISKYS